MKLLQEIKKEFTDDIVNNLEIMKNYLLMPLENENDIVILAEISSYMKDVIGSDMQRVNKYKELIIEIDNKFFNYVYSKAITMNANKNWEEMLGLISKLIDYFQLKLTNVCFESQVQSMVYNIITNKVFYFRSGIEGWAYSERAIIYKNLGLNDLAIRDLLQAIKFNPMTYSIYVQLFLCLIKDGNFEDFKKQLDESYNIIIEKQDLGLYYYFNAVYYLNKNNLLVAHACAQCSLNYKIPLEYRNMANKLLAEILVKQDVIKTKFALPYNTVLTKNNIPTTISKNVRYALVAIYKQMVNSKTTNKFPQVLKLLKEYKLNDYVEWADYPTKEENMLVFEEYEFSVKFDRNWKINFQNFEKIDKIGSILELSKENYNLFLFIDTFDNTQEKTEKQALEDYSKCLEQKKFVKVGEKYIETIKKSIKIVNFKDENNNTVDFYIFKIGEIIGAVNVFCKEEYDKKEVMSLINSIKHFSPII